MWEGSKFGSFWKHASAGSAMTGDAAKRRAIAGVATAAPRAVVARAKRAASLVSCIVGVLA